MKGLIKPNQIEFQWYMHYKCNYRCPYCYFLKEGIDATKKDIYLSLDEWLKLWDKVHDRYGSVQIQLTGGEPSIYPSFIELVKELSKKHTIKICTNLSGDFERLSEVIDPNRIKGGIGASFHPVYVGFDTFLKKALILQNRGFFVYIVYVTYPPQLKQMRYYIDKFREAGLKKFVILPFRGEYREISYPDWYPDDERKLIWEIAEELGEDGSFQDLKFQISKDYPKGEPNLSRENPKGRLCRAGQIYAVIDSDGAVTRCGEKKSKYLGTFFDGNFNFFDAPLPCENSNCNCEFKYLVEEEEKVLSISQTNISLSRVSRGRALPLNKIYINWDIHYSCNYHCSYCFFAGKWEEIGRCNVYPGIQKWIEVWQRMYDKYGTCRIDISGGEPSIYPSFFELVKELSQMHDIRITSNLSFNVSAFAKDALPIINKRGPKVMEINSSFKPEFVSLKEFFKKVIFLKKSGFTINVTYVAFPPHLNKMHKVKRRFEDNDIEFVIQPFRGKYEERLYPRGYTEEEKKVFDECYNGMPPPLVNYFIEDKIRKERKLCRMGQIYAKIYPNGEVHRCCAEGADKLGNIINDKDFSFWENPAYCDLSCPCWKAMIVDRESEWLHHWKE